MLEARGSSNSFDPEKLNLLRNEALLALVGTDVRHLHATRRNQLMILTGCRGHTLLHLRSSSRAILRRRSKFCIQRRNLDHHPLFSFTTPPSDELCLEAMRISCPESSLLILEYLRFRCHSPPAAADTCVVTSSWQSPGLVSAFVLSDAIGT